MLNRKSAYHFAVVVSCLMVAAVANGASTGPTRPSSGCGSNASAPPGESVVQTIKLDDVAREYRLHLPAGYDLSSPSPLVLVFHGYTGTAEALDTKHTSFSSHADGHGYVVVYPQGTGFEVDGTMVTSWNDRACSASPGSAGPICTDDALDYPTPPECGEPKDCDWCSCNDDVGFVAGLFDKLEGTLCLDLNRVYATGISNGAMLVHRLGCDSPEIFAAIAPVAGTLANGFNCAPKGSSAVSIMNIYGTLDTVVPFDGAPASDGFLYTPTSEVMGAWAAAGSQRCSSGEPIPYTTSMDGVQGFACVQREGCATGAEVVDCAWEGGHDWPRSGEDQFSVDVIWEFFEQNGN